MIRLKRLMYDFDQAIHGCQLGHSTPHFRLTLLPGRRSQCCTSTAEPLGPANRGSKGSRCARLGLTYASQRCRAPAPATLPKRRHRRRRNLGSRRLRTNGALGQEPAGGWSNSWHDGSSATSAARKAEREARERGKTRQRRDRASQHACASQLGTLMGSEG